MRGIRSALLLVVWLAVLAVGAGGLFLGWQLGQVVVATRPKPRTLTVAELLARGPGANLHVRLTAFTFGEPVVEETADGPPCVWVRVYPAKAETEEGEAEAATPAAIALLRAGGIRDRAGLAGFLRQQNLEALVTTPLSEQSLWKVTPGEAVRRAHPQWVAAKVILAADPRLEVGGFTVLNARQVYDPLYAAAALALGVVCLGLGGCGLFRSLRGSRPAPVVAETEDPEEKKRKAVEEYHRALKLAESRPATDEKGKGPVSSGAPSGSGQGAPQPRQVDGAARDRLGTELAYSVHEYTVEGAPAKAGNHSRRWLLPAVLGLGCLGLAGFSALQEKTVSMVVFLAFGLCGLGAALVAGCRGARGSGGGVWQIAVCPSGLRCKRGRQTRVTPWAEMARVRHGVGEGVYQGKKVRNDTFTIDLHSGESWTFVPGGLTEYHRFAAAVEDLHRTRVGAGNEGGGEMAGALAVPLPRPR
jgi:hypothetical protein